MEQITPTILACVIAVFVAIAAFQFKHIRKLRLQLDESRNRSNRLGDAQKELAADLGEARAQCEKLKKENEQAQRKSEELQHECNRLRDDPPLPHDSKLTDHLAHTAKRIFKTADQQPFAEIEATASIQSLARAAATSMVRPDKPRLVQLTTDWTPDDEKIVVAITIMLRATNRPPIIPHGQYRTTSRVIVQHEGGRETISVDEYKIADYEPKCDTLRDEPDGAGAMGSPNQEHGAPRRAAPTKAELLEQLAGARSRLSQAIEQLAKQEKFTRDLEMKGVDFTNSLEMEEVWRTRIDLRTEEFEKLKEFVDEVCAI